MREKKRHLEGFILDLDYKRKELEERKKEIIDIDQKILNIAPKIDEVKKIISDKKFEELLKFADELSRILYAMIKNLSV